MGNRLVLKDVVFVAPRLEKSVAKYETKGKDVTEREFQTRILITRAQAKQYKKDHPICSAKVKMMEKPDFEKAFNFTPDDKFLNAEDEYSLLSFNRPAGYPDLTERTPPKIHALKGTGIKLKGKIIGTGSEGHIQFSERDARDKKKLDIEAVYLSSLVPYVPKESLMFEVEDGEDDDKIDDDVPFETEDQDDSGNDSKEDDDGWGE